MQFLLNNNCDEGRGWRAGTVTANVKKTKIERKQDALDLDEIECVWECESKRAVGIYRDGNEEENKKIVGRDNRLLNSLESEIAAYSIHFVWIRGEGEKNKYALTIIFTQIESERVFFNSILWWMEKKYFVPTTFAHQRPINFLEMKYKYPPRIHNEIGRGYFVVFSSSLLVLVHLNCRLSYRTLR